MLKLSVRKPETYKCIIELLVIIRPFYLVCGTLIQVIVVIWSRQAEIFYKVKQMYKSHNQFNVSCTKKYLFP